MDRFFKLHGCPNYSPRWPRIPGKGVWTGRWSSPGSGSGPSPGDCGPDAGAPGDCVVGKVGCGHWTAFPTLQHVLQDFLYEVGIIVQLAPFEKLVLLSARHVALEAFIEIERQCPALNSAPH